MAIKFRRMGLLDVEDIISSIDEVFGYKPMDYELETELLKFREPIVFAECSFIHFVGVSITIDEEIKYKMFNSEENVYYFIDGFDI